MPKVAVIVPAAGAGKRFGGDVKKPFAQLDNRPLFIRAIELFVNRPDVCQVLLTVAPDDYDVVREKYAANLMFMNVRLVKGGNERFESVRAALREVDPAADLVCIHDAVRPCVLDSWIDTVFEAATKHGGAILAAPLTGTIKRMGQDGLVEATVSRERLYEAQTPQVFERQLITSAYQALAADARPTDDAQVLETAGGTVRIVPADRRNIKITAPGDMALASAVLKDFARQARSRGPLGAFEEAQW
jgi:2-C-methyl-D-erythritol 4-phosphate cytidylyltransferase